MSTQSGKEPVAPYGGVRILDLSRVLAGPYATLLFADLGAEVIKVENHLSGDDSRGFRPPHVDGVSTYFLGVNRNKRSLAIDLKHPSGKQAFLALAANSDVVVENFRTGVVERLGIDYDAVRRVRPDIIYCSISGYGRTGSQARRPGYDPVAQAECGLMDMTGELDGPPNRTGPSLVDMVTGMFAAQAVSAALWHRSQTGEGQYLEVCLFDTALNMLINYGSSHLMAGDDPTRSGNGSAVAQPSGTYQCLDGPLMLTVASERVFRAFCAGVLDDSGIAEDARFATNPDRIANCAALDQIINDAFGTQPRSHWLERLDRAGVPCGAINSIREAFALPLVHERQLVKSTEHPVLGPLPTLASPMRLARSPVNAPRPAPDLGQDSRQVLAEVAHMSDSDIDALIDGGVVSIPA